ncbi:flagellar M-ring protein FliF [bacterium]|nr:flagellar M-ring protein FliF [bacterium]MBU1983895.1 flagellar M-ring protein FliF [bacterium]
MATLFRPFVELWQRLTLGQRAGLVLAAGLVIALAAGAISYTTRPVYTTLYTGLSGKDAAQIVDKLRERKIPFQVSSDGTAIKVPQEQASELRLDFAGAGLPRSGEIGYELFDKPMLGMTDFVQHMNYHRALEGELGRTISELDAIETARVHLVVPSTRLFKEDQKQPTASIAVQLSPGGTLSPQQVQAITYMTAYSVEGLEVGNITIIDTRGNLLSGASSRDGMVGLSATQLEVQRNVEADLERKALALLDNTLGPNRAQVQVTAKLNWNRIERTVENYDAENSATLSEERQESTGDVDVDGAGGGTSERSVTNYQVPRTVEKYVPEVGNIERISASVLVDGDYEITKNADGTETRTFRDRTAQEIEKFRTLVATAIGFDRTRNDELTVISFPFAQEEPLPVSKELPLMKIIEKVLLGLALIGLFLLVRSLINRLSRGFPALPAGVPAGALPQGQGQVMLASGVPATPAELAARAEGTAAALHQGPQVSHEGSGPRIIFKQSPQTIVVEEESPSIEVIKHQELLKRTTDYIVEKPEQATQILRGWILDESSEKFNR